MLKLFGKDFVGINYADDNATNKATTEDAGLILIWVQLQGKCSLAECGGDFEGHVHAPAYGSHGRALTSRGHCHEREKFKATMLCGFCGGESAQKSNDL